VNLVQVDPLDAEPTQTALTFAADRLGAKVAARASVRTVAPAALGAYENLLAGRVALNRASNDFLGTSESVDRRGVDPVDACVDGAADCGDRLGVVDRAPPVAPRPADSPGPQAETGEPDLPRVNVGSILRSFQSMTK
jgi:hypothetical protein